MKKNGRMISKLIDFMFVVVVVVDIAFDRLIIKRIVVYFVKREKYCENAYTLSLKLILSEELEERIN